MLLTPPKVFRPLWEKHARFKGAYGGRASGKSFDRASACVVEMLKGKKIVGVREVQESIKESVKALVEEIINASEYASQFRLLQDEIICTTGGSMIFRGLQDHTAESIKSLQGREICWAEESHTLSERSITLLTPTIRATGSELWFTWNPRFDTDPIDKLLRGPDRPEGCIVVEANYSDNPFFPPDLVAEMERDKRLDYEKYLHVWEGQYQRIGEGAYFANELARLYALDRITSIPAERNEPIYSAFDIGIDDFTAIWVCQPVGRELRLIDYYQDRGYDAKHYATWLRDRDYDTGTALLPHDAGSAEKGSGMTYEQHLQAAGLRRTIVLPRTTNLMGDIQEVRAFLATCWFDRAKCEPEGLKLLGRYRVAMDKKLNTPLPRPVKDGSDHCADAFRTLAKGAHYLKIDEWQGRSPNLPNRYRESPNGYVRAVR